jgi:hypothetical protein
MNIFIATIKNGMIALPPGTEFSEGDEIEVRLRPADHELDQLPEEFFGGDPASLARMRVYEDSIPPFENPEQMFEEVRQILLENRGKGLPARERNPAPATR